MTDKLPQDVFDSISDYIYMTDSAGQIIDVNQAFCNAIRSSRDSLIGNKLSKLLDKEYSSIAQRAFNKVTEERKSVRSTKRFKAQSGDFFLAETLESPVIRSGSVTSVIGIGRDITQEDILENRLWNFEEQKTTAIDLRLRTSIGLTKGYIYTLAQELKGTDEKFDRYIRVIEEEVEQLARTLEDLLDYNSTDLVFQANSDEIVNVKECLEQAGMELEAEITRREIQLLINVPDEAIFIKAQRQALKRIFVNLLQNSIQHTLHTGIVSVNLSDYEDYLDITVTDNGSGIPEEELPFIFEKAYYSTNKMNTQQNAGMGLAITKLFVEALGGKIWAKSKIGHGTEFHAVIPRKIILSEDQKANILQTV